MKILRDKCCKSNLARSVNRKDIRCGKQRGHDGPHHWDDGAPANSMALWEDNSRGGVDIITMRLR